VIDTLDTDCARRLRDVERAGKLRNQLYSAAFGACECARMCLHGLHEPERAEAYLRAADFYADLYEKVLRLQARARGEG
jgi:hypothetical protein